MAIKRTFVTDPSDAIKLIEDVILGVVAPSPENIAAAVYDIAGFVLHITIGDPTVPVAVDSGKLMQIIMDLQQKTGALPVWAVPLANEALQALINVLNKYHAAQKTA